MNQNDVMFLRTISANGNEPHRVSDRKLAWEFAASLEKFDIYGRKVILEKCPVTGDKDYGCYFMYMKYAPLV